MKKKFYLFILLLLFLLTLALLVYLSFSKKWWHLPLSTTKQTVQTNLNQRTPTAPPPATNPKRAASGSAEGTSGPIPDSVLKLKP